MLYLIREQICLETHFQYENSILGHFGQVGCREKKNPNCLKYATFDGIFFMFFMPKKVIFLRFSSIVKSDKIIGIHK
jgi:hypothetical protein